MEKKKYFKNYREVNKVKIKEYQQNYHKNYYVKNKDTYEKRNRTDMICIDCNLKIRRNTLISHVKTNKHKNNINLFYINRLPYIWGNW